MKNKVVWITGASSGIGEALVSAFAAEGAKVVLSARRIEELQRVKVESGLDDERAFVLPLDITETTDCENAAKKVVDRFRRIDIMVHSAGISNRSFIKDTPFDVIERVMQVNFFGTVALTKAVLPYMMDQASGRFVVLSSMMGKFASPGRGAYASSKHALHGFFDTLRMEHYEDNIKITIVCPGFVRTNVTRSSLTASGDAQGKMDMTTARGMEPQEAAGRILQAVEKDKQEVYFGGKEVWGVYLKRFFPSLLTKMVLKNKSKWEIGKTAE